MIPNLGPAEILIVLVVAVVVFGSKRLPELGSSLGRAIRGFGEGVKGDRGSLPEGSSPDLEPPAPAAVSSVDKHS